MLSRFVSENRNEIISRCRARVASRMAPRPTDLELEQGIPLFLDQLAARLRSKLVTQQDVNASATKHGSDLLRMGFSVAQVVNDYGDTCQSITELAIERHAVISAQDFQALNLCLDEAIAGAVTEYERIREIKVVAEGSERATEDLGFLAHELRNLLGTATLAFDALRSGSVGIAGGTGATLGRSLTGLRELVDRSLSVVRLNAGIAARERITMGALIEEVEISAMMEAKARGHQLTVEVADAAAVVVADRQILASVIANIVQNALKYSHPHSHVSLRILSTTTHVLIAVEDECGGLPPGKAESLFKPFAQQAIDRSGLGLGLAICARGVEAIGGSLHVRDLPGKGCVFTVELPRAGATT